jgi:hypothetical protein
VHRAADVSEVFAGFALLEIWRLPAWVVVLLAAGAGQWIL